MDFGGGLERLAWVIQDKKDIFGTDNFWPIIEKIQEITHKDYYENDLVKKSMRIVSDHIRACVFLAMDGVLPDNKDQGYILRRLLRKMIRAGRYLGIDRDISVSLVPVAVEMFKWLYPDLEDKKKDIEQLFKDEEDRFIKTLEEGQKQISKIIEKGSSNEAPTWAKIAFDLYQSVGYPQEIFLEDIKERKVFIDEVAFIQQFEKLLSAHQVSSRSGSEGKFKGGLADHSDIVVKYHTLTHLLQAGLRSVLGSYVSQTGSNITNERARFDFAHPEKLTEDQIKKVEDYINDKIKECLPVQCEVMDKEVAIQKGVGYMKHETYPDKVKVYYIGTSLEEAISKEFCGGPHVENTGDLSHMHLYKQENIGKGKRRIYIKFI